ncbi:RNA polymerase factor sigma-54 [Hydrogenothermus marinus]|uniref:RNA polymerase RpoN-/SigL-like sigma 54 subunit n=1 Tax=Hydrogenothermus marinus TaxID=133270 RepID=A0A3M0BIY4_9AQUI|nr:RNA polymerase factor sigma-54 [Hydrogenothermus marinus]RMA97151.1 RNA polymerase RpoN-/SigL-like sigma 54 subunit [Hydrogenothermus marinus]
MKQTLNLKLSNKLVITLSLKQQIKILTLNKLELKEEIRHELEENPFLEEIANLESDYMPLKDLSSYYNEDEEISLSNRIAYTPTLFDILDFQIDLEFEGKEKDIAREIIGNLDEKGLLDVDIEDIANKLKVSKEKVEEVRKRVLKLEPTGIGAKSIEEYLITQYEERYGKDEVVEKIIKEDAFYLNDIEYLKEKYSSIHEEELKDKICNIKQLTPYPTFDLSLDNVQYIEPDIFIVEKEDGFDIKINETGIPNLKLTTQYKKLINKKDLSPETKKFLEEKLEKAIGIIKGIQQRRENLEKITKALVEAQTEFLKKGKAYLKPLTLKDISEKVELHESTISRIISNKYAYTPLGVIPLKSFLASKVSKLSQDISSEKVKYLIKEIIEKEDKKKPLSDEGISKVLRKEYGIRVARRTIAKYREELKIPNSTARRKKK